MIGNALLLLREELKAYLQTPDDLVADPVEVLVENIGLFETDNGNKLDDHIVLSVVNVEEESTLKNGKNFAQWPDRMARYENRPVFLNLYMLVTANYSKDANVDSYANALNRLSKVIQFFQSRSNFTPGTASVPLPAGFNLDNPAIAGLRLTVELYTLTFEQINHLWGSLGGRQVPFVMYKVRLVMISERTVVKAVPLIEEIETNLTNTPG